MTNDRLVRLDRQECLRLIAGASVGRVVHTERALPSCTPVNFRLQGDSVVFRTAPRSRLALATADAVVAFEVDEIEPRTGTGWSVLATGVATAVRDVSTLVRLEQLGLISWAGGERTHWVRISLVDITGRRVADTAAASEPPQASDAPTSAAPST